MYPDLTVVQARVLFINRCQLKECIDRATFSNFWMHLFCHRHSGFKLDGNLTRLLSCSKFKIIQLSASPYLSMTWNLRLNESMITSETEVRTEEPKSNSLIEDVISYTGRCASNLNVWQDWGDSMDLRPCKVPCQRQFLLLIWWAPFLIHCLSIIPIFLLH